MRQRDDIIEILRDVTPKVKGIGVAEPAAFAKALMSFDTRIDSLTVAQRKEIARGTAAWLLRVADELRKIAEA